MRVVPYEEEAASRAGHGHARERGSEKQTAFDMKNTVEGRS
jgi:hypothetical protein